MILINLNKNDMKKLKLFIVATSLLLTQQTYAMICVHFMDCDYWPGVGTICYYTVICCNGGGCGSASGGFGPRAFNGNIQDWDKRKVQIVENYAKSNKITSEEAYCQLKEKGIYKMTISKEESSKFMIENEEEKSIGYIVPGEYDVNFETGDVSLTIDILEQKL